jgi:hypothetical protein
MRKRERPRPPGTPIEIEIDGKPYRGSYFVEKGMITVSSPDGVITTHSSTVNESLARTILRELSDRRRLSS